LLGEERECPFDEAGHGRGLLVVVEFDEGEASSGRR